MQEKFVSLQRVRAQHNARRATGGRLRPEGQSPNEHPLAALPAQSVSFVAKTTGRESPKNAKESQRHDSTPPASSRPPLPQVPITSKYYLTVKEAVALAGLPLSHIRRAIADAVLPAMKSGGYQIKREDLERLAVAKIPPGAEKIRR
jgi:excisionase family DNA binding protein